MCDLECCLYTEAEIIDWLHEKAKVGQYEI